VILARSIIPAIAVTASLTAAAPARADVLEVGVGSSHWIAGGTLSSPVDTFSVTTPATEVPADLFVPDIAVADLALQASTVPAVYSAKVQELAERFDLSPALIEALVWQESRWQANARSPVGARGLAQLMPGTAKYLGVNPDDPFANLEGGARYLREQLDRFDGDLEKALAAYNAGPGRVEKANGIPRIRETQNYVTSVMGRLSDHSRK
jgi:soluble lytic murein transglycosylase-like protein